MTIFGIDVSRYQAGVDMARARAEGMDFVFAKVTEGATYRNPAWAAQRDGARKAGMLLAGYHYVRTDDPALQAANCRTALGDTSIPIMLDWEQNGGDWPNLLRVLTAFRHAGLRVVLGYLPRWYWSQTGSPALVGSGLALVSSRYPTTSTGSPAAIYRSVTATTWSGYGGLTPTILQFSDRASVAGMQVDANAYQGTRAQLAALLGATSPTPAPRPTPAVAPPLPREDVMYIKCKPDATKPDIWTAIWNGPVFMGLGTKGELDSAAGAIATGATVQWVEKATWDALDRISHQLCDPHSTTVNLDPAVVTAAVQSALGGGLVVSLSGTAAPKPAA